MSNKVDIGKVSATGYLGPAEVTGGVDAQVGPVSIAPQQDVGAPAAPGGASPLLGFAVVPFSEFYAATGGDKAKAEAMVPGITTQQGAKLLQLGPDGKPMVQLKTVQAQALFDQGMKAHQARKAGGEPEWLPLEQAQEMFKNSRPEELEAMYPGGDEAGGMTLYQRGDALGRKYVRNPKHPKTAEIARSVRQRQGVAVAEDGE